MKKILLLIVLQSFISGCDDKKFSIDNHNADYRLYRKNFDSSITNQFPDSIAYEDIKLVSNTNRKKNDIGLLLYEYDVDSKVINKIKNNIRDKAIAIYKSNDKCLLIVNRFETYETYKNFESINVEDSLKIEEKCAENLYPIPNFIEYNHTSENDLHLDDSFEIYVLEAKSGTHWKDYDLQPSPQMPIEWKNGYSKGIALSKQRNTVIYWSIIW